MAAFRSAAATMAFVLVGLILCEAALRAGGIFSPWLRYQMSPPWDRGAVPDAVLGYRPSPYSRGHDAFGYRNEEAARAEILALGDSLTYGFAALPQDSWPKQLQKLSGKSVYNAGVAAYSPCEYEVLLEELAWLEPRVIVVGLYLGNDLAEAYRAVYKQGRFASLRTRDEPTLAALEKADRERAPREAAALAELGLTPANRPALLRARLLEESRLYRLYRSASYALNERFWERSWDRLRIWHHRWDSFEAVKKKPRRFPYEAEARLRTVFLDPALEALAVDSGDPRIKEGGRLVKGALLRMQQRSTRRGARFIVALLPGKPQVYARLWRKGRSRPGPPDSFVRLVGLEAGLRKEFLGFFKTHGIESVDALGAMQASLLRGRRLYAESDDIHPNADGYRALAAAILPSIERR